MNLLGRKRMTGGREMTDSTSGLNASCIYDESMYECMKSNSRRKHTLLKKIESMTVKTTQILTNFT